MLLLQNIFQKFAHFVWPIERKELSFFAPMALIMTCALYNFASLRAIKDSLIVSNIGAESISFLKLWLVLPSAIVFTLLYLNLSNNFRMDRVFYIITGGFLIFFSFFCFFLLPGKAYFHPNPETIENLATLYPNFKWFFKIAGHWTFAIMYIFSELWSVVIINLMFWQFANHVVDEKKAQRFYPLFGLVGNFGLIIAGNAMIYFASVKHVPSFFFFDSVDEDAIVPDVGLRLSIISVIFSGMVMMLLMLFLNKTVIKKTADFKKNVTSTKTKLSLRESISLIISSRYVGYITAIIICYGLAINVLEGPWKAKIKELYPSQEEYMAFMGHFNIWMGISCVAFMLIGSNILRIFSWRFSALFTPLVIGVTGVMFFAFVIIARFWGVGEIYWINPLAAAVIVGAVQNILSKSTKYSLFDSTKEMAYIPLSVELKTKGKAAAEVVGAKFGKSLGAIIQSSMFTFLPNSDFSDLTPILLSIFLVVIIFWIFNVLLLSTSYEKISNK
ncbi:MAG: Npt1/Npt2 family nucleotide transporter [Rickettsiaceae bacterium]|nr:Npt1/Npt2 family nucleotide transporter [Rickettsiaceae bacterium]